jgi:hypothetical protein
MRSFPNDWSKPIITLDEYWVDAENWDEAHDKVDRIIESGEPQEPFDPMDSTIVECTFLVPLHDNAQYLFPDRMWKTFNSELEQAFNSFTMEGQTLYGRWCEITDLNRRYMVAIDRNQVGFLIWLCATLVAPLFRQEAIYLSVGGNAILVGNSEYGEDARLFAGTLEEARTMHPYSKRNPPSDPNKLLASLKETEVNEDEEKSKRRILMDELIAIMQGTLKSTVEACKNGTWGKEKCARTFIRSRRPVLS